MVKTESSLDTSWLPAPPWGQGIREWMTLSFTYVHKETIFSFGWQSTNTSGGR